MAQPIPPHVTERRLLWRRLRLYLLAGLSAAMFTGTCAAVSVQQAKARRIEAGKQAKIQAQAMATMSADEAARQKETEAWIRLIGPFRRAHEKVRELEWATPVDKRALAKAVAQRDAALAALMEDAKRK